MGLISLLIAIVIIILLLVFGNSPFSPFTSRSSIDNPKTIRDKAQDAVEDANKDTQLQQDQINNIDPP